MPAEPQPDPLRALSDDELLARLPKAAALPDAPAAWVQRAEAAWQAPLGTRVAGSVEGLRQRVQAWLSFDSWAAAPLAAGLRSTGSTTRQLVFSAEGRDVDLRIVPAGARFAVNGQVLGQDETGSVALVLETAPEAAAEAPAAVRQVPLDALGEFHLADVEPGRYRLSLLLPARELVLPPFDVGGPIRFSPKEGSAG
ncbi:MAG TPA: hypothetical protein VGQ91_16490 [Ideonella sp.]|nr:hypothetical protein [Ideonella sp.]